ncbi:hypothetical protein B0J12DRAFT_746985 [Macrophomina phaseolina]|uniref:DUF1446 domain-containing protein n=1 Tax=Macrophomina phaseolina TaxID=35725 RepID=A0ABQ8FR31_9PEZI|nr:hypothetical protein B0J12DRAFT_746985 [Macrophomina phaseolina]
MTSWRTGEFGQRPVRIANCSGYCGDPADEMYKQATLGNVDFITGDYLAEVNIAKNAEAYAKGQHPGYEPTAWEGLRMTLDTLASKRIKVALNGGALNPRGLAAKVSALVAEKGYGLRVAYVSGDDLLPQVGKHMPASQSSALPHLDAGNKNVSQSLKEAFAFLKKGDEPSEIVSANAYLGARGIATAFRMGADIVICGRVSDASPVIGAAWYWWGWSDTDYDALAGALVAGHLIECSAYSTGGNFAAFQEERYGGVETFLDPGFPIAEVEKDGSCVVTKHKGTGGVVDEDTVRCQLLYELQGNVYMHSDSKAVLDAVLVECIGKDRVRVSGIRGLPPPPTTKLAIFYKGGYECQLLVNAAGYGWKEKCDLFEKQVRFQMGDEALQKLDFIEFQRYILAMADISFDNAERFRIGVPAENPLDQNSSTIYIRVVAQARTQDALLEISKAVGNISLKHFHGFHASLDMRTAIPRPYVAYFPATWDQSALEETAHFISASGDITSSHPAGHPPTYECLYQRSSYDTASPATFSGPTTTVRLGDIALARSGDKGSNLNVGVFVHTAREWDWLRTFLSRDRMWQLLGRDADESYAIERVEFPKIFAVHFVIYGILGRGVSSSTRLDAFGKAFADYLRDKVVELPVEILEERSIRKARM